MGTRNPRIWEDMMGDQEFNIIFSMDFREVQAGL